MAMCYTFHISPPQLNISHQTTFPAPHLTFQYHQITWCDVEVWCGIWCDVERFAIPDVGRCGTFIHPNVAVMWNKLRTRIRAIWCDATCDVMRCQMCCEMW